MTKKVQKLKKNGLIYKNIENIYGDLKKNLGFLWKLYLIKKIIKFKKYSCSQKIKIMFTGADKEKWFLYELYKNKYKFLERFYQQEQAPIVFSNKKNFTKEELKCFFSCCDEVFYSNCYKTDSLVKNGDAVLDLGGNIGLFSIYVKELYSQTKIYIFEPEKKNFQLLKKNLSQYENIVLFNYAAGDKNEIRNLKISKTNISHQIEDSKANINTKFLRSEKVEIKKLDGLIKGPVDVIKMDIEGYESKALLGARNLILKNLPLLIAAIEHYPEQKSELEKIIESISKNYRLLSLNKQVVCFFIPEKHKSRIEKLKLIKV